MSTARRFKRLEDIAFRQIGDECLLVPVRNSPDQDMAVFALNRVAAFIWESLAAPISPDELAQKVVARFEVALEIARRDTDSLLGGLMSRNLIEQRDA
jgi:hypothetical protein